MIKLQDKKKKKTPRKNKGAEVSPPLKKSTERLLSCRVWCVGHTLARVRVCVCAEMRSTDKEKSSDREKSPRSRKNAVERSSSTMIDTSTHFLGKFKNECASQSAKTHSRTRGKKKPPTKQVELRMRPGMKGPGCYRSFS